MGRVGYSPTNNFDGFFCLAFTTVQLNPLKPQSHLGDRQKVKVVERLNKSRCMDCPPKKVAVVERSPLVEVGLYL